MSLIQSLNILLSASTQGAEKGIEATTWSLAGLGSTAGDVTGQIESMYAALGVGTAIHELTNITLAAFEMADSLAQASAQTGASVEALSELRYVAKLGEVEFEGLTAALTKMNKSLAEAANSGKGDANDTLKKLGLSARELVNLAPEDSFTAIAEGISRIQNPAEQSAAAMAIFGKSGASLLPLLQQGASGIEAMRKEAADLGLTLSDADAGQLNRVNDAMDRLTFAWEAVGQELAVNVAPVVAQLLEDFLALGLTGDKTSSTIKTGMSGAVTTVGLLGNAVNLLLEGFYLLQFGVNKAIQAITWPIARLFDLIDGASQRVFGKNTGVSQLLREFEKEMASASANSWKSFADIWDGKSAQSKVQEFMDRAQAGAGSDKRKISPFQFDEEENKKGADLAKSIDMVTKKLEMQVAMFGKSSSEQELFKLKQEGANDAMLAQASALTKQLATLEAQKKTAEEVAKKTKEATDKATKEAERMAERGKSLFEAMRTPLEEYNATLKELNELLKKGAINQVTFDRAAKDAKKKLDDAQQTSKTQFAAAIGINDKEFFSAFVRHRFGGQQKVDDHAKVTADNTKQLVVEMKKFNSDSKVVSV